jgi:hypothetical protein
MKKTVDDVTVPDIRRQKITLAVRCGDCMFLKSAGVYKDSSGAAKPCATFGTVAGADPCRWFTPNPRLFNGEAGIALRTLSKIGHSVIIASLILAHNRVENQGLSLGQVVYFHVMGGDYINNYASGSVIGVVRDTVILEGIEGHVSQVKRESLLNDEEWSIKLANLIAKNRINDPVGGLRKKVTGGKRRLQLYKPRLLKRKKSIKKKRGSKDLKNVIRLNG